MTKNKSIVFGPDAPLSLESVRAVALERAEVKLSVEGRRRIEKAHQYLLKKVASGETFYGINTGFGLLSNVKIPSKDLQTLQLNLLRSHAVGVGPALPVHLVRAMLLLRAQALAFGNSGVSAALVEQLVLFLNKGVHPVVPEQGSVGASGDLAPLSHLALPLVGEGWVLDERGGKPRAAGKVLKDLGIKPVVLGPKEGLALINGTQFMSALGVFAVLESEQLVRAAHEAGALSMEALRGTTTAYDELIQQVRPHAGQAASAERMRGLLFERGKKSTIGQSHASCDRVQDPYSLRCIPQVHGPSMEWIAFVRGVVEREINSVTDNPLIFPEQDKILSGGNFHGQVLAMAMDSLAIAVAELGSISEQRIEKLINPAISGLPAFLTAKGGIQSGLMIVQVAAASLVSENKGLCHPASVDTIPTSADKEDHVSMGAWAARKALKVIENARRVLAMEFLAASRGISFLRPLKSTRQLEQILAEIDKISPPVDDDHSLAAEIEALAQWIQNRG